MDASSVLSDDLSDYDVISDPGLESSIGDLGESSPLYEPQPADAAIARFVTPSLSADSIQLYVAQYLEGSVQKPFRYRRVRVYVDGIFDPLGVANALQLRQAKLSFPAVHLMVGVFSDLDCELNGIFPTTTHAERCELVRHCRWVDEVISEVPWQLDETFASDKKIDYVAIDEGITVDPRCDKLRVRGYDKMKGLGKVILTRRTKGVTPAPRTSPATPLPASPVHSVPVLPLGLPAPAPEHMDIFGIGI